MAHDTGAADAPLTDAVAFDSAARPETVRSVVPATLRFDALTGHVPEFPAHSTSPERPPLAQRIVLLTPPTPAKIVAEAFRTKVKVKPSEADPGAAQVPRRDDLTRIRGIDHELAGRLSTVGVTRFAQIAAWGRGDVQTISQTLALGRAISRENWIEQAALLVQRTAAGPPTAAPSMTSALASLSGGPASSETLPPEVLVALPPVTTPRPPGLRPPELRAPAARPADRVDWVPSVPVPIVGGVDRITARSAGLSPPTVPVPLVPAALMQAAAATFVAPVPPTVPVPAVRDAQVRFAGAGVAVRLQPPRVPVPVVATMLASALNDAARRANKPTPLQVPVVVVVPRVRMMVTSEPPGVPVPTVAFIRPPPGPVVPVAAVLLTQPDFSSSRPPALPPSSNLSVAGTSVAVAGHTATDPSGLQPDADGELLATQLQAAVAAATAAHLAGSWTVPEVNYGDPTRELAQPTEVIAATPEPLAEALSAWCMQEAAEVVATPGRDHQSAINDAVRAELTTAADSRAVAATIDLLSAFAPPPDGASAELQAPSHWPPVFSFPPVDIEGDGIVENLVAASDVRDTSQLAVSAGPDTVSDHADRGYAFTRWTPPPLPPSLLPAAPWPRQLPPVSDAPLPDWPPGDRWATTVTASAIPTQSDFAHATSAPRIVAAVPAELEPVVQPTMLDRLALLEVELTALAAADQPRAHAASASASAASVAMRSRTGPGTASAWFAEVPAVEPSSLEAPAAPAGGRRRAVQPPPSLPPDLPAVTAAAEPAVPTLSTQGFPVSNGAESEADVLIVPRSDQLEIRSIAPGPSVGTLEQRVRRARPTPEVDVETYAGYHGVIGEASVEIVRRDRHTRAVVFTDTGEQADRVGKPAAGSLRKFFKGLKGTT
jgi:predicted flap endonuclease-1-like 5' DNA nuclease